MAKARISKKPTELRDQLMQANSGIVGEASWPVTAPTAADVTTMMGNLFGTITQVEDLKSQLSQARATLHGHVADGVALMKRIDEVTDGLYGSDNPKKNDFGLPPKKSTAGVQVPLGQVLITKIEDGVAPASVFVDWDTDAGASAYQVEWFTDAAMTAQVGNAAVSASEYEVQGLVAGQQYWIRVRGVRGNEYGQWSDPATRVANCT